MLILEFIEYDFILYYQLDSWWSMINSKVKCNWRFEKIVIIKISLTECT